jgi:hypothetical protein
MPHTRSSCALPSRTAAHRSQVLGPSSGPLSRKNALGRPRAACPAASRQRAESAVSRLVLAAHTEGQRMATYLRHIRLRVLVTLHEFTVRISPLMRRLLFWCGESSAHRSIRSSTQPQRITAPWCGGPRSRWTMTPLRGRRRAGLVRRQRLRGVAQLDANGTKGSHRGHNVAGRLHEQAGSGR